jgi:small-conductance mechanosensitive channel
MNILFSNIQPLRFLTKFAFLITVLSCFYTSLSLAEVTFNQREISQKLEVKNGQLEVIEKALSEKRLLQDSVLKTRKVLKEHRDQLTEIVESITPFSTELKGQIEDLGPVSEDRESSLEPKNIQKSRKELNDRFLIIDGLLKQGEALTSKSNRLLEKIGTIRRSQFVDQLFQPQASPFKYDLWVSAKNAYQVQLSNIKKYTQNKTVSPLTYTALILFIILFSVTTILSKRAFSKVLTIDSEQQNKSNFQNASSSIILPLIGVIVGLTAIYHSLALQEIVTIINSAFSCKMFGIFGYVIFVFFITSRLSEANIIRPTMRWLSIITAVIYAIDFVLLESGRVMGTPLELAVSQSYIVTTIFSVLLGSLSVSLLRRETDQETFFIPRHVFIILLLVSICIVIGNALGYVALSRFIFERIVLMFSLLTFVLVIRGVIQPYLSHIDRLFYKDSDPSSDTPKEHLLLFWLKLILDTALLCLSLPFIAWILGADWIDIKDWVVEVFFGFKVGAVTISIADICVALALFFILLFMTKSVQRVLNTKILPKTKMDVSVRHSIVQILGYVGLIVSIMVGISAVGFDLTNLALIAGALSVGIGFGLQSIVSNFVSGLILLFERPIKAGDWVIVNSGEGLVKKISVRATEIETFDRTSIIVPNSELISSSVKNWTHKDKIGRVVVPVGVSYNSDPHKVREVLLQCIQNSSNVLKNPEPSVYFKDFGDSALIFESRFFIKNISDVFRVSNQIRFDIWDALKKEKI